jgi:hypothetical protein
LGMRVRSLGSLISGLSRNLTTVQTRSCPRACAAAQDGRRARRVLGGGWPHRQERITHVSPEADRSCLETFGRDPHDRERPAAEVPEAVSGGRPRAFPLAVW